MAIIEGAIAYARHAVGDGDRGERVAIIEGAFPYTCHAVRDGDRGERGAAPEGVPYACHAIGDDELGDKFTIKIKRCSVVQRSGIFVVKIYRQPFLNIRNVYSLESVAISESTPSYARHAVRDGDRGKRGAIRESIAIYVIASSDSHTLQSHGDIHAVIRSSFCSENVAEAGLSGAVLIFADERNGDGLERNLLEGAFRYLLNAVGDSNICTGIAAKRVCAYFGNRGDISPNYLRRATRKRIAPYARHAIGDGDTRSGVTRKSRAAYFGNSWYTAPNYLRRAALKRTTAYTRHAIGDGDRGERIAT